MRQASLCLLIRENEGSISEILLAMKKRGFGQGRWNGVGGKPDKEKGETVLDSAIRETEEEIGVKIKNPEKAAIMDFCFPEKIKDKNWDQQVLIIGKIVKERDSEKLHELFNTSHKIGDWEIEELLSNNPEIIIIGTGQNGAMQIDEDLAKKLKANSSELIIAETPQAIEIYNEQIKFGKRVNALIHTTC
jgi:hypothetical protein